MSKEATVYVVDVSPMMYASHFESARTTIKRLLEQKILADRKTEFVDLILVGFADTKNRVSDVDGGYPHIFSWTWAKSAGESFLAKTTLELFKFLDSLDSNTVKGDVVDGVIIALDAINAHCKNLKYLKTIYLFTDATSPVDTDSSDAIKEQMSSSQIKLVICGYDFEDPAKQTVVSFLGDLGIDTAIHDGQAALEEVVKPMKKKVRPTATKQVLFIGSLEIPITLYTKTTERKVPMSKKMSSLAEGENEAARNLPTFGKIELVRMYQHSEDNQIAVEPDERIGAYRYGKTLIPFTDEDKEASKLVTTKGMIVIGTLPKATIGRHFYFGSVTAVVPNTLLPEANARFSSFVAALHETQHIALVRYCRADNAAPKIGVLVSMPKGYAYFIQVPFQDDMRRFPFSNFEFLAKQRISVPDSQRSLISGIESKHSMDARKAPVEDVYAAIDDLIDAMDLDEEYIQIK